MQQSPEEETPFVYVTLATLVTLATAGYTPCLFGYVTIGLARHNRTHFSQSERLWVKPKRPCTDLCAEPVGVWNRLKRQGIPCFFKIPTVQQSPEEETPFVYVTLATHVTLATAGYTPCLFGHVTIGLARHNRTHFSQSERLLVKPQRPWTDLCAEPVGRGTDYREAKLSNEWP